MRPPRYTLTDTPVPAPPRFRVPGGQLVPSGGQRGREASGGVDEPGQRLVAVGQRAGEPLGALGQPPDLGVPAGEGGGDGGDVVDQRRERVHVALGRAGRSEERSVGKEWGSTCRSRW